MIDLKEKLIGLELKLHSKEIRASRESLDLLIADDFREIGSSGLYFGKVEVLDDLPSEDGNRIEAENFEFRRLSESIVHLTYKSKFFLKDGTLLRTSFRTSIWRLNGARWQMIFHQGTLTQ